MTDLIVLSDEEVNMLDRVASLENRMFTMEHDTELRFQEAGMRTATNAGLILDNTEVTKEIGLKVDEVFDVLSSFKGAFKVLGWLGTFAKWMGYIAIAISSLWALILLLKGGISPKP